MATMVNGDEEEQLVLYGSEVIRANCAGASLRRRGAAQ